LAAFAAATSSVLTDKILLRIFDMLSLQNV
jgi:hypothetical protein